MKNMLRVGCLVFAIGVLSTPAWSAAPGGLNMDRISINNNSNTCPWNLNTRSSENPATAQGAMKTDGAPVLIAHGGGGGGGGGGGAGAGGGGGGDCGDAGGAAGGESGGGSGGCSGSGGNDAGASGNGNAGGNGANSGPTGPGADNNQM